MPQSSPSLRRFVHHTLLASAGATPPAPRQSAAAFDGLHAALQARLHPMFGQAAVAALFARAVQQAAREYPWVTSVLPSGADACVAEAVTLHATRLPADVVAHGLAAVLAHQIALLTEFIGEDVTMPLIHDAWQALPQNEGTEGSRQS